MILSNCTNSRTCSHRVYGNCIYSTGSQKCRIPVDYSGARHTGLAALPHRNIHQQNQRMEVFVAVICEKLDMPNKPPTVQALKTVWSKGCYPNAPCVLPNNLMAECPHCGQQQISFFQIRFIRSAIPRPAYRCLNFWYP